MSVQTQIDRISGAVSAALTALAEKGVTVPDGTKVDGLAALIAAIEAGGGGSGGGSVCYGSFSYADDTTAPVVEHGLGELPNFVVLWKLTKEMANNYVEGCIAVSSDLGYTQITSYYTNASIGSLRVKMGPTESMHSSTSWSSFCIHAVNENNMKLKYLGNKVPAGITYYYVVGRF